MNNRLVSLIKQSNMTLVEELPLRSIHIANGYKMEERQLTIRYLSHTGLLSSH